MSTMVEGIQNALTYMEENLAQELSIKDIAEKAYMSEFYFQRIFGALCGFSVGEYIRNRRLALAAQELAAAESKVIDVAIKYGYDSPDSFTRAFTRFHGITPSAAREKGAKLRDFAPLRISISLTGGTTMEYKIVEKAAITLVGRKRVFNSDTSYQEIPKFWTEHMQDKEASAKVCGMFGLCIDSHGSEFDYLIADEYQPEKGVPEGCETRTLPAGTWAVFPCKLKTLQETNTKMWKEWLPNCREYKLGSNYNIEMYGVPCKEDPRESYVELWLPIVKVN
ncbi:MAG: AraC family transcriptional regulator [Firmicutes bacterium]|nr:AraC family transcriptional regulator [Bacillota bacterium]